jgi:uncharacterized repeat protein (TIGR03847 family)
VSEQRFTFHDVSDLLAASRGVPGKRTFYFLAGDGASWVRVWLEKEQLQALSDGIEELLASLDKPAATADRDSLSRSDPPGQPAADFRGGRLGLGYDADRDRVVLMVEDRESESQREYALQFAATRPQMKALAERIAEVCAAGRPTCPLCGSPMDPAGHACVRSNGHHPVPEATQ